MSQLSSSPNFSLPLSEGEYEGVLPAEAYTIAMALIPIGWAVGGAIAHFTTNETSLITSAIACITITLAAYIASPAFRRA